MRAAAKVRNMVNSFIQVDTKETIVKTAKQDGLQ